MTNKQAAFVREYLIDLNATQAAIRAGYSENTAQVIGAENLSKPIIKEAIDKALARRAAVTELNAEWVLTKLKFIAETCAKPDASGRIDSSGANKATELIGKHIGMFTDRIQADITATVDTTLTLDEKLKLIDEIRKRNG